MNPYSILGKMLIAAGFISPLFLMSYARVNELGPIWFWASDVCPEPNVVCGIIPVMIIPAAMIGVVLVVIGANIE